MEIGMVLFIPILGIYAIWRLIRALENRSRVGPGDPAIAERMARLEEGMSSMSSEISRLAQQHDFTMRLLKERAKDS
jgi:hypothetical protein